MKQAVQITSKADPLIYLSKLIAFLGKIVFFWH